MIKKMVQRDYQKTLLVTGAAGMVGSYVQEIFNEHKLILTDVKEGYVHLDVQDFSAIQNLISQARPDYILHLAAFTDVDRCELEPDLAFKINTEGARNVARACLTSNSIMIYLSTGAIFNGEKKMPYIETDKPDPLNKYGMSKYEGEKNITLLLQNFYIIRASWMIGGGKNDKKFVGKIVHKIMSGERHIKVVNDKFGSITYARDLLYGIKELIKTNKFGMYHMTNGGMYSRYEIAKEIVNILGKDDVEVVPVSSEEFPLPAPRGYSEALENHNLNLIKLNFMEPWKYVLREYITTELLPLYR